MLLERTGKTVCKDGIGTIILCITSFCYTKTVQLLDVLLASSVVRIFGPTV